MGTEILRPHYCLTRSAPSLQKPSPTRRPSARREARKRRDRQMSQNQVTILKRGESLDAGLESAVFGTGRLGPDPTMVPKQIRVADMRTAAGGGRHDMYAGSGFGHSPSPRALPLPKFAASWSGLAPTAGIVDSSATQDLRRLLRLDRLTG